MIMVLSRHSAVCLQVLWVGMMKQEETHMV